MNISGKTAVVTGAKGAIGSNLVSKLEMNGVRCVSVDYGLDLGCDFTDPEAVEKVLARIRETYKDIDFLFNVAGIGIYKNIEDLSYEDWEKTFLINVHAPFLFSKHLMSNMGKSGKSMILNVGSGMGVMGTAERSAYCSSKFALRGLSLSLFKELKNKNIDVVHLTLGSVMTPFGSGGIEKRKELERNGKKYLSVDEVTDMIIQITKSDRRDEEYTFYPDGYM